MGNNGTAESGSTARELLAAKGTARARVLPYGLESLSGLAELNDPEKRADMFRSILDGLDRGTTQMAAGIGTWNSTRFLTLELARVKLDAVTIHLYPAGPRQLDTLAEACRIAREAGKPILLDEAWLYKIGPGENEGMATSEKVFKRNIWSFWTPLDQRFLTAVDAFARAENLTYLSPFWSHLYFARRCPSTRRSTRARTRPPTRGTCRRCYAPCWPTNSHRSGTR